MQQKACATCVFAFDEPRETVQSGFAAPGVDLSKPSIHQCRRYPPSLVLPDSQQRTLAPQWPRMLATHWCGEYTPRGDDMVRR